MNNLCVLIIAWVTVGMQQQTNCTDPNSLPYLQFIYYGSIIVVCGTFILSVFYMLGVIDFCINRIIPCG